MLTLLHASDLQYGRPFRLEAAEALISLAESLHADVTVVSGDLTQRAKADEFRGVRRVLDRLPGPVLVTPGNHDVPLYRVWERLAAPYRNWTSFIAWAKPPAEPDEPMIIAHSPVVNFGFGLPSRPP